MRLHQAIALEKGNKSRIETEMTENFRQLATGNGMAGIQRTYRPKDEDGDRLPPESTRVQASAEVLLAGLGASLAELFDLTITKDTGNQLASANVEVDGQILLQDVPVTTLLFLEKKLVDLRTIVDRLPALDPAEVWHLDEATGYYRTEPNEVSRSKKLPRNHVKAEATDRHPAQVEVYMEDVQVGFWTTTKFSGALPVTRINELRTRVIKLQNAVKLAREEANSVEIARRKIGEAFFGYLLAP